MSAAHRVDRVRHGFTIVEVAAAAAIFSVVTYVLLATVRLGAQSQREVIRVASSSQSVRDATRLLQQELRQTTDAQITVAALADGNSELTFRHAIEVGGFFSWGVFEPSLGPDAASQTKPNWRVRYTVQVSGAGAEVERTLVRQLLDEADVVQDERPLVRGLCDGFGPEPGFRVSDGGAVWVLSLAVESGADSGTSKNTVVHVNTLN